MSCAFHDPEMPPFQLAELPVDHPPSRLLRNFLSLIKACPCSHSLGDDAVIRKALDAAGLTSVIAHRLSYKANVMTIIVVPGSIWHEPLPMLRIRAIKRERHGNNRRTCIIPESVVHRQPRLSNSQYISNAAQVWVPPEDRMAVLLHLIENGYSTVIDCAREVKSAPPVAAVFQMISDGTLMIDLDKPILPHSRIDLISVQD
ncbi:hypothetical protein V6617_06305 [Pelagibacterium nitratireducens]|uniref:Uncharacterized protein n=1 Tax=Pelagibacterium nitratireducens TaxID=1046114 RepID=A0ABZ2I4D5_9HYPH